MIYLAVVNVSGYMEMFTGCQQNHVSGPNRAITAERAIRKSEFEAKWHC